MEAAGNKIRSNSQGWEDVRVIGAQLYLLPAKFENIDQDGLHEAGYGPATSNERRVTRCR